MCNGLFKILLALLPCILLGTSHAAVFAAANSNTTLNQWLTSLSPKRSAIIFQVGGFNASQGDDQLIGINGLIGDEFTVAHDHAENILLGLGYYIDGLNQNRFSLMYGLNAFYFAHTSVEGNVIQEQLFTNLAYRYSITNFPIYAAVKSIINMNSDKYIMTLDLGVGPNIIKTSNYNETSLDGITIPEHIFSGATSTVFSATAGIGVKFNNIIGHLPLEVGYRFFYLGQGNLKKVNSQVTNTLSTGKNYANALIISTSV